MGALTLIAALSGALLPGCSSRMRFTSDPTRATIFVRDLEANSEIELGQTPLRMTVSEIQKKLGKSATSNNFYSFEARTQDFETSSMLVPFSRLLNFSTDVHLVLKPVEKNPVSEQAKRLVEYLVSAQKFLNQGDPSSAMIQVEKALTLDPEFEMALLFKGHLLYFQGKFTESLAIYNSLISISPTHPEALKMIRAVSSRIEKQGGQ